MKSKRDPLVDMYLFGRRQTTNRKQNNQNRPGDLFFRAATALGLTAPHKCTGILACTSRAGSNQDGTSLSRSGPHSFSFSYSLQALACSQSPCRHLQPRPGFFYQPLNVDFCGRCTPSRLSACGFCSPAGLQSSLAGSALARLSVFAMLPVLLASARRHELCRKARLQERPLTPCTFSLACMLLRITADALLT